jgi:putative tRNA adenosine deaminase-associated protein
MFMTALSRQRHTRFANPERNPVPHFAAGLSRRPSGWSGEELDLKEVEDLDGVIEEMRRYGDDAEVQLMFVEEDDEWFAIVRVDEDGDPRVFLSDGRVMDTSTLGALFGEAAAVVDPPDADDDEDGEDDDEEDVTQTSGDPIGDPDVLADLGTPAARLLALCAEEGQLPADIISTLCENAGCLEPLDALRLA